MRKKHLFVLCVLSFALMLTACGSSYPKLSGDEALAALKSAKTLYFTGDLDDVNTFSDILADEQIVGEVKEKGLINNRMIATIDGKEHCYCKYVSSGDVMQIEHSGTTYGVYDMDDNCLGYMQQRFGNGTSWYAFLQADCSEKDYRLTEDVSTLCDSSGHTIGTISRVLDSTVSHAFHVEIKTDDGAQVDYTDKLIIYWASVSWLNDEYSYLT